MISEEEEFLTVPEAAAWLRIHPKTAYDWCEKGKIPSFKANGRRLVSKRALLEWVRAQGKEVRRVPTP